MNIQYLSSNELIKKTINGTINIVDGIKLSNDVVVSYSDNLNKICYIEKIHLIDILINIKNLIEKKIIKLLNEKYIKNYINHVLSDEWLLSIEPINIIDKENINFTYSDYYKYSTEYKNTKNKKLIKNFQKIHKSLIEICKKIEPTYMYILLDLSNKPMIEYLKYNEISDKKLVLKSDMNIRFMNYIQIINLIKKELNIIINECHSTIKLINK